MLSKTILDGNAIKAKATALIERISKEKRRPNHGEQAELDGYLDQLRNLKQQLEFDTILGQLGVEPLGSVRFDAVLKREGWHHKNRPSVAFKASDITIPSADPDLAVAVRGVVPLGQDQRFLYSAFQQKPAPGLAVRTLRVKPGSRDIGSGDLERDPLGDAEKVRFTAEVEAITEELSQVAVLSESIPNAALDLIDGLPEAIRSEMGYQLDLAIDTHVVNQIAAASPPGGSVGGTLVEEARAGIEAMRAVGRSPSILALNGSDAADLATQKSTGGSEEYVFDIGAAGQPTVFGLRVIESPAVSDPLLIDPSMNVLYLGPAAFASDPYSQFSQNLTALRVEALLLFSVSAPDAIYQITAGSGS